MASGFRSVLGVEDEEVYRRAGFLRTFGLGRRPAVLVVDVQYDFTGDVNEPILDSIAKYANSCGPAAWQAIPWIARVLERARAAGVPVLYTFGRATKSGARPGSRPPDAIAEEIAPQPGDVVIAKPAASPFFGTPLVRELVRRGVDTIIHTGCTTSGCVRAGVVDAAAHGYRSAIVEEAVFDRAVPPHLANLLDMDAKYGDVVPYEQFEAYLAGLGAPADTPSHAEVDPEASVRTAETDAVWRV